jgi:hypothetical protein
MTDIPLPFAPALSVKPPHNTGIYFWWFGLSTLDAIVTPEMREALHIQTAQLTSNRYALLYVGKAADQTLFERTVNKHLGRSAHVSTLRHSLGSLIANRLDLPRCETAKAGKFAVEGPQDLERRITDFLHLNAMLSWVTSTTPTDLERQLLGDYNRLSLPLNIAGNRSHPFCRTLCSLRKHYARC